MLNKEDFILDEIQKKEGHIDYYFSCSEEIREEIDENLIIKNIIIEKLIYSVDEDILVFIYNDNGYVYPSMYSNEKKKKRLIEILSTFVTKEDGNNKKELDKDNILFTFFIPNENGEDDFKKLLEMTFPTTKEEVKKRLEKDVEKEIYLSSSYEERENDEDVVIPVSNNDTVKTKPVKIRLTIPP